MPPRRRQQDNELHGDGFMDWIRKIKHKSLPDRVVETAKKYLNKPITEMWINRSPVESGVKKFLNIISLGAINRNQKAIDVDEIYHNFLICRIFTGQLFRLEKNHVCSLTLAKDSDLEGAYRLGPFQSNFDLMTLINKTLEYNKDVVVNYDAQKSNCQNFCYDTIVANKIGCSQETMNKIVKPQDSAALLKNVPKGILSVTDIASAGDRVLEYLGLDKFVFARGGALKTRIDKHCLKLCKRGIMKNKKNNLSSSSINKKMTTYSEHGVRLTKPQAHKLMEGESVRLSHAQLSGPHKLALTKAQKKKVDKAMASGCGMVLTMSQKQVKGSGFFSSFVRAVAPVALQVAAPVLKTAVNNTLGKVPLVGDIASNLANQGIDYGVGQAQNKLAGGGLKVKKPRAPRKKKQPAVGAGFFDDIF